MDEQEKRYTYRTAMMRHADTLSHFLLPEVGEEWHEAILGDVGYPNLDGARVFTKWQGDQLIISDRGEVMDRLKKFYAIDTLPLTLDPKGRVKFEGGALQVVTTPDDMLSDYMRFRALLALMLGAAWYANQQSTR